MKETVVQDFVKILHHYMQYYGLYSADIRNLVKTTTDIVKDFEQGKNGPTLKKIEAVANIFGLKYYEFGTPNFPMPTLDQLPLRTREKIEWRKETGPPESKQYQKLDLNQAVLHALAGFDEDEEFLASDVYKILPEDLQEKLGSPTRITGLFSNELYDKVTKTGNKVAKEGPGRPEEYYKLTPAIKKRK